MTAFTFDARSVEPDQGRVGAMPKGWYRTMVEKTEIKPTSDGSGAFTSVMFGVIDGPYKGTKFFNNFNIKNNSEKALEIGLKQLSALCHAVGVLTMTDTDQLKGIPFCTRLKYVEPEYKTPGDPNSGIQYEEKNEPSAYRNINDQAAIEAMAKQASAPAGPAGAPNPAPPPPAAAPAAWAAPAPQQAPAPVQQAPVQQAPVQQAPAQWQAPPVQQAPVQQAPVQQQAPQQWAPPAGAPQPWDQQAQPAAAPQQQAPAQQTAPAAPPPWAAPAA